MEETLIDTSIWIDYFKSGQQSALMDILIEENLVLINEIILAELVPYLQLKRQGELVALLQQVKRIPLNIQWQEITELQYKCLKNGINGIGIPDLIIAQNALQNERPIYSLDKHFRLINDVSGLKTL